jgi:hypothetical protein
VPVSIVFSSIERDFDRVWSVTYKNALRLYSTSPLHANPTELGLYRNWTGLFGTSSGNVSPCGKLLLFEKAPTVVSEHLPFETNPADYGEENRHKESPAHNSDHRVPHCPTLLPERAVCEASQISRLSADSQSTGGFGFGTKSRSVLHADVAPLPG